MCNSARRRAGGFSLIELVVFIVVLAVGVTGVAILFDQMTRSSVDPVVRKQALAIATSLMEEVELHAFTYCDPDDPAVRSASSVAACATPETSGPEPGETRYADPRFDNVNDYDGFSISGGMRDIGNTIVPGLGAYAASVSVQPITAGELPGIAAAEGLRVTVSVTGPANANVVLQGYRLRYAPNLP